MIFSHGILKYMAVFHITCKLYNYNIIDIVIHILYVSYFRVEISV